MEKQSLLWWASSSGRIELQMTIEQASSVNHSGQCDDDVLILSKHPDIKKQLDNIRRDDLVSELLEYGTWNINQLDDFEQNIQRLLWIAGCDIDERPPITTNDRNRVQ